MTIVHHYTAQEAIGYIQKHTTLFAPDARLVAKTITNEPGETDGYVNIIHIVKDANSNKSVAVKQVLPYVRAAYENGVHTPLPMDRMGVEVAVFKLWRVIAPEIIPDVYWQDEANGILVMEDLSSLNLLRFALMRRQQFPHLPEAIGSFLGKIAFYFSDLYLPPLLKHKLAQVFASPPMHALFEEFIFEETFFGQLPINPLIQVDVTRLLADDALRQEVLLLKDSYAASSQTLIHNDFHTSNICVNGTAVKIFDGESACFGPIAFDLARLIGNIVLNYASWEGVDTVSEPEKATHRAYLLRLITKIYEHFAATFTAVFQAEARPLYRGMDGYTAVYLRQVLQDMVGFAGCTCLARIYDHAECYEFESFHTLEQKAAAQRLVIQLTQAFIMKRGQIDTIADFTALIEETEQAYRLKRIVRQTVQGWMG